MPRRPVWKVVIQGSSAALAFGPNAGVAAAAFVAVVKKRCSPIET